MPNPENLEKGKDTQFKSGEEAAINGAKGGVASGKARKEKADLKRILERLLDEKIDKKDKNGKVIESISTAEALVLAQIQKALRGDTRAFETVRDTAGQKPVEKVMISEVSQEVIDEVEKAVFE